MTWIQNKKAELINIKQIEWALMNQPNLRAALNRYISSLNLQGQINRGAITEQQASELFKRAIQQFSYALSKEINQRFTPQFFIDNNDLTNPLNMAQALNNPNSLASILMNDTADAIMIAINAEANENEQVQYQQQTADQPETQAQEIPTPVPTPAPTSHEKEELLVAAVLGASLGKEAIEHAVEKYIGKEFKNKLGPFLKEPTETKSIFDIPTLKPKPPTPSEKK